MPSVNAARQRRYRDRQRERVSQGLSVSDHCRKASLAYLATAYAGDPIAADLAARLSAGVDPFTPQQFADRFSQWVADDMGERVWRERRARRSF